MDVFEKLKDLNMTADETDRLTKAFKDEKFKEMLLDYAQEISDPENKKKYEEEIKLLEQERGNSVEFIHPTPFRALRTSVDGKQKCFINICANDHIGKPQCECGLSEEGRRGQRWSLPHSLHPGRQETDPKGNKIMIYDVTFHPDTLHIASKNKRFMDMVNSTAIQGIQNAFKVTLDKNNIRVMKTKYKGTPQSCVIKKPIPGYKAKEPPEKPDPFAFPYPDEKRPTSSSQTKPTDSPTTKTSDAKPTNSKIEEPQETKTEPKFTVKYRSFVDLQDFRCSRDSARSPRPKEIVVTVDLPLMKSVADTNLEVKDKSLLLESKDPAYRLVLPLAYPVDEDKGEATFNKQKRQLVVTLPVLPSNEAFDFALGPNTSVGDAERDDDDDEGKVKESEEKVEELTVIEEEDLREQTLVEKQEDKGGDEPTRKDEEGVKAEESLESEEEDLRKEKREVEKSVGEEIVEEEEAKWKKQNSKGQESEEERGVEGQKSEKMSMTGTEEEEKWENKEEDEKVTETQSILVTTENLCGRSREVKTSDIEETGNMNENIQGNVQLDESQSSAASSRSILKDGSVYQRNEAPETDKAHESSGEILDSGGKKTEEEDEDVDEDDLQTEQIFQLPGNQPPPVILREIDEDGNENIISDHTTCAGFVFQNSLVYELD